MSNINSEEIRALKIPLPPLATQQQLFARLDAARGAKIEKGKVADDLIGQLSSLTLAELRVSLPPSENPLTFGVRLADCRGTRCDPPYHAPTHKLTTTALKSCPYPRVDLGRLSPALAGGIANL